MPFFAGHRLRESERPIDPRQNSLGGVWAHTMRIGILRKFGGMAARSIIGTVTNGVTTDPVAAITFDDGPHPSFTPRIIEILRAHRAYATFFMIGEAAQRYPDLVRQVAQAGHAIGNHSWDHPCFPSLSGRERRKQITDCRRAIAPYGCQLFRPPYGDQNLASRLDALWMRYQVVTWSIDTKDWLNHTPEGIVDKVLAEIQPGCIILFHDGSERRGDPSLDRTRTLRAVSLLFA